MDFKLYCFYDFNGCYIFHREILRLAKPPILQCIPCIGWQLHVAFIAMVMKLYLVVYDMLIILYTLDFVNETTPLQFSTGLCALWCLCWNSGYLNCCGCSVIGMDIHILNILNASWDPFVGRDILSNWLPTWIRQSGHTNLWFIMTKWSFKFTIHLDVKSYYFLHEVFN